MLRLAALLAVLLVAGCGDRSTDGPAPVDPGDAVAQATVQAALTGCLGGTPGTSIARLDTLVAARPDDVDALATRGMCHRVAFAADSSAAAAEAAMADLTAAIDRMTDGTPSAVYTLDRLYAHRSYVHESLDPGVWTGTIADLQRATQAAPGDPTHRLDLGVARSLAGDTTGAIAELRRFLEMAPEDTARGAVVQRQLLALGDSSTARRR